MYTESIILSDQNELKIVDQTLLPSRLEYINIKRLEDSIEAIKKLKIRGAPAIGIMAAYTIFVIANKLKNTDKELFLNEIEIASQKLGESRPTAVNLIWAIDRIKSVISEKRNSSVLQITDALRNEAVSIHQEDKKFCHLIGINGLNILPEKANIVTHCNTGTLATGGWGTALGIIYAAHEKNIDLHVYVDETRPLGQGARLTLWELNNAGIPCTLITDSMAAALMAQNNINIALFGADRIAANGDVANKIGSYNLAVAAKHHKIPCYAVAPSSTFDLKIRQGDQIPIEERSSAEILDFYNYKNNENLNVFNPAFDITPASLLTGIVTEKGIIKKPIAKNIKTLFN